MCLLICNLSSCAQTDEQTLPSEVEETIKQQCIHKVRVLTDHFDKITSKVEADSIKDYHIDACLDLFIGRGNDTKDYEGNVIIPAPKAEVFLEGRHNIYPLKSYLKRLKTMGYYKIIVKNSYCYYVNPKSLKKVGDNQYSAIVTVYKVNIGNKGDLIVYRDKTMKSVQIILENTQTRFNVFLGDISVDQTESTNER